MKLKCPNCGESVGFRLFMSRHDVDSSGEVTGSKCGGLEGYLCLGSECGAFGPVRNFEVPPGENEPIGRMSDDPF